MKALKTYCIFRALSLSALILFASALPLHSFPAAADPLPRRILALYDGAVENLADCRIRRWAEAPLNHLGYVLVYRDVHEPLPAPDRLRGYAAVLTWFGGPIDAPKAYLRWATAVARHGLKYIILGETGGRFWTNDLPLINELLGQIGIRQTGRYVDVAFDAVYLKKPPRFEASPDAVLPPYPVMTPVRSDLKAVVELGVPARDGGGRSVVAAYSSRGGFVASGFEMLVEPRLGRVRWLIDPYAFFRSILDPRPWPRPDVTTLSGRRSLFVLVDIGAPDAIARRSNESPLAVLLHKVAAPHPGIPMTLSFNPEDFRPDSTSGASGRDLLQALLRQNQIEGAVRPEFCARGKALFAEKKACLSLAAFSKDESALQISPLAEKGARIGLIQIASNDGWSDAAARAALRLGLRPIQEVFSRYSASYPSVANIAPLARNGLASPIVLLPGDAWSPRITPSMEDFIEMEATAEKTGNPRRLAPLFWHFQLKALDDPDASELIERKLGQFETADLIPISVRDYVSAVDDFARCEIERLGPNLWRVSKLGAIHTFRLDDADGLVLDLSRSVGVLGARRHGDAIYVSIDAARNEAVIALHKAASPSPSVVGLRDSRWSVSDLQRTHCGWAYRAAGFGRGAFTWYDVPAGRYDISATGKRGESWSGSAQVDASHHLRFSPPLTSNAPIQFKVRCDASASTAPR